MALAFDNFAFEAVDDPQLILPHEFFERQVDLKPDHPAIEFEDQLLTYYALDAQANRIARLLQHRGIGPESLVGLYMGKSPTLFAALLGILKAGAGYVPVDPECPIERLKHIIADANLALLITEQHLVKGTESDLGVAIIDLNNEGASLARYSALRLGASEAVANSTNVCYVIYTSGSTGRPKGVVLEHRNLTNFITAMHVHYGLAGEDRIYQGFSIAFDASVEEVWAAFSMGGTLVVPPKEIAKSPVDAANFITARNVTYFSTVPTFLSLIEAELPSVRLLVLGGEPCCSQLVSRWANGKRRLLNTYGPTETAIVATLSECVAGEPVTIGRPMAGLHCLVVDQEGRAVPVGQVGELLIGGDSVARGYLNLPEQTDRNFVWLPSAHSCPQRYYRTRDLVRLTEGGELEFLGRSDDQIKIRGFRVELAEIEAVLMEHPSVLCAAVKVDESGGSQELAAYIIPSGDFGVRQRRGLADLLSSRLPAYMYPKYLEIVEFFPTLPSGKVDRSCLARPQSPFILTDQIYVAPTSALERTIVEVLERYFRVKPISVETDFFLDLKGDSISAAHVVTELRATLGTSALSSRDIYNHRTIRRLASYVQSLDVGHEKEAHAEAARHTAQTAAMHVGLLTRWTCVFLQALSLAGYYAIASAPIVFFIIICERVYLGQMPLSSAATISVIGGFAIWPSWLAFSILIKWVVIGRYKAGRYPLWGSYFFRWWLVSRFQGLGWPEMFSGTPLMSLYYRAMGAKIGREVSIGTALCSAFDLISVGDNTSIGSDVQSLGYRIEDGWLIIADVQIGHACFVGMHCALGLNVRMEDGSRIGEMSFLPDGAHLLSEAHCAGSPLADQSVELPAEMEQAPKSSRGFLFGLLHLVMIYAMGYCLLFSLLPSVGLVIYALYNWGVPAAILTIFAAPPIAMLSYAAVAISVKRLAIGRVEAGVFPRASVRYLRYWFLEYLMNNSRHLLLPVYATVFLPSFLRLMGAKIGRGVEISTIMHAVPDLLEVEEGSFLADACIVGGHRVHNGWIELRPNKIGRRSFVGNSAIVPGGVVIGQDSLIGVMSTPPTNCETICDGTRWLGSPSFEIPYQRTDIYFNEAQTYEPRFVAKATRILCDIVRILLPGVIVSTEFLIFAFIVICLDYIGPTLVVIAASPLAALYLSFVTLVWAARVKSTLVGKFRPHVAPLWSRFVWLNEIVNGVYETVAATALAPMMGTPFVSMFLRQMGCKVGRWVFLETTLFSEFDLVEIGDYAALNMGATIQTHLFEDRVMKSDYLKIGAGCSVGNMAVVLYGTEMQQGSVLAPLSLLMKGETLAPFTRWHGIPNQQEHGVPPPLAANLPESSGRWSISGRLRAHGWGEPIKLPP